MVEQHYRALDDETASQPLKEGMSALMDKILSDEDQVRFLMPAHDALVAARKHFALQTTARLYFPTRFTTLAHPMANGTFDGRRLSPHDSPPSPIECAIGH